MTLLTLISCKKNECDKKDTITNYKFNSLNAEFYNYNKGDIISCKIANQELVTAIITDTSSGINTIKENMDLNCGTGDIINFDYKESIFFDNRNELFLIAKIKTDKYNEVEISFDFYHDKISSNSFIKIDINEPTDTATINNKLYTDIYIKGDNLNNTIHYSKSKGLLQIKKDSSIKFILI